MANSRPTIIGTSKSIRDTMASASRVARTSLSVLITGESGTGKELFAQFIHDESPRARKPFIAVNCAAIPGELLEAELFGHKKGAFSGAMSDRDGLFAQADGGTLFLDEIGDMPLPLQAKILRVIQEREIRPVGGKAVQKVDIRIVAATHRDLDGLVAQGKFREDLVFRLRGYALRLPPLRERGRDVIILSRAILKEYPEFAARNLGRDAQELLLAHPWAGNVRELRNVVLAAAVDAPRSIGVEHLRHHLAGGDALVLEWPALTLEDRLLGEIDRLGQPTLAQLHERMRVPKPTLHRHLSRMVEQGKIHRLVAEGSVRFAAGTVTIVSESPIPDRQAQAIRLAKEAGRVTRQQFADAAGISIRTASRELAMMVNLGLLTSDGHGGKMGGYIACNR